MTKRNKKFDADVLSNLLSALLSFQKLKIEKWEKVEGQVEATNLPGTPTEDWIIPPDENVVSVLLMKDQTYRKLREEIEKLTPVAVEIAHFLKVQAHSLGWLKFTNPLIGNDALDDAISTLKEMQIKQKSTSYLLQKIKSFAG